MKAIRSIAIALSRIILIAVYRLGKDKKKCLPVWKIIITRVSSLHLRRRKFKRSMIMLRLVMIASSLKVSRKFKNIWLQKMEALKEIENKRLKQALMTCSTGRKVNCRPFLRSRLQKSLWFTLTSTRKTHWIWWMTIKRALSIVNSRTRGSWTFYQSPKEQMSRCLKTGS